MKETLIIRSTISSHLVKRVLFKGSTIAFLGIILLLIAGILIPPSILHEWGWALFFISIGLITLGLLPYRRLSRLQLKPNELVLINRNDIAFYFKGNLLLTLSLQSVAKTSYIDHPTQYGIAIWLKPASKTSIAIHQLPEKIKKMQLQGQQIAQADLFFPYFNQRAYDELMEWQEESSRE